MKQFLFLLIMLCAFACTKNEGECTEITFGESLTINTDSKVCIDNIEYTFIAKDERCCCGCVCVWEGEFLLSFEDADGAVVYTFHESLEDENMTPPFGESMEIITIENKTPDCGDESKIDEVDFTIRIN